jgi:hypothetical protein
MIYEGFNPTKIQTEILSGILESNVKYHIINTGRQIGKTITLQNLMLYWAINDAPVKILFVAPVYSQVTRVQKEMMAAIGGSGLVANNNYSDNELTLTTGSTIYFRSAERYDNIRGGTFDMACLDEAAFIKEGAWTEAIKPTLLVRGKKVVMASTPNSKNWFYDIAMLAQSPDYQDYKFYKATSYDTPYISHKEIEDAKRTVPDKVFKQEYLAEFLDGGGEVFSNLPSIEFNKYPKPQGKLFAALDIGRANDFTCCIVMDQKGNIVDTYRNNKDSWNSITKDVIALVKKWNANLLVETNGVGDPIYSNILDEWKNTHPFTTTNKSKQEIIEGLILDVNEKNISIPSKSLFGALQHEMETFTYKYNPKTRSIQYGHPQGGHDDTVIALALVNYNRKQNVNIGTYAVMGYGR